MLVVRTMDRVKSKDLLAPSTEYVAAPVHRSYRSAAVRRSRVRVKDPSMHAFAERIKQYPAKEQAELSVRIKVPGSWFRRTAHADRAS